MKILWLINVPLPEASELMGDKPIPYGGWLSSAFKLLSSIESIDLCVAFPYKGIKGYKKISGNKTVYYAFGYISKNNAQSRENLELFEKIINDVKPDLVHIHGTEFAHSLSMLRSCELLETKVVVSIQGLVSKIEKHMYADLPSRAIYAFTLRNLVNRDSVYWMRKQFKRNGINEINVIRKTRYIIGRTTWDRACTYQINPEAKYYFCHETLREKFYKHIWNIKSCSKYSLFLSQAHYSIKGLHYVLETIPIILKKYPETIVYISGKNITQSDTLKDRLTMPYYGKYIKELIAKYGLRRNVIFTGPLNEEQMCQKYLESHVFICPSSIENSPNSLGEAMLLGVPCVASYVGGIPDMLEHGTEGFLYQHNAPYMLAHYIMKIFDDDILANKFSCKSREKALKMYDQDQNTKRLIEIYKEIICAK